MARQRGQTPKFLVCEVKVEKPRPWQGEGDDAARTIKTWHTLDDEKDVKDLVNVLVRPGFGSDYESIRFEVHRVTLTEPEAVAEVAPATVLDHALRTVPYDSNGCTRLGSGVRVEAALLGGRFDRTGVFWDARGNSFAVVHPPKSAAARRLTSDQGVMLLSINGIGEIRWDVDGNAADMPENREAVTHFGLSWVDALLRDGVVDGDEAAVLKRVDWFTVLAALRKGRVALRELILLHAALQTKGFTAPLPGVA